MYKRFFDNKKAVFFDLDGTIADTQPVWRAAFAKIMNLVGADLGAYDDADAQGTTPADVWDIIIRESGIRPKNTINELVKQTITEIPQVAPTKQLEARDGFWSFVYELKEEKKFKLALVSNDPKDAAMILLDALGIKSTFDLIVSTDDVKNPKPAPDMYLLAAKQLGISPKEVLVFEDSVTGAYASVRAKMDTIVIWDHSVKKVEYPREVLAYMPDFSSFPGHLDLEVEDYLKKVAQQELDREATI